LCRLPEFEYWIQYSFFFFFSSRRRHTRFDCDWSSDVCSSDLNAVSCERFVHGHQKITRAQDTAFRPQCLLHRFAKSNSDVFDGVMLVHVKIATRIHSQVKRAMARKQVQHVVKETNPRGDAGFSAPIQIEL